MHSIPVIAHGSSLTKAHISLAYQCSLFKILKQYYKFLLILQYYLLCFLKLPSDFGSTTNILNTSIKIHIFLKLCFFPLVSHLVKTDGAEESHNWKLIQNIVLLVFTFPMVLPCYVKYDISFTFFVLFFFFPSVYHQRLAHLYRNGNSPIEKFWCYIWL